MTSSLLPRPIFTWEEVCLRVDLDMLELWLNRKVAPKTGVLRDFRFGGEDGTIELEVALVLEGVPARLAARLRELRVYKAMLGCEVLGVTGPLGLPLPISLVASLLRRHAARWASLDPRDRILLVDLRRWLPAALHLHVQEVRCSARWLELELAPGSFAASFSTIAASSSGAEGPQE